MASGTTMSSLERESCTICVGGKTYTMAAYKKMLKEKKQAEEKATKTKSRRKKKTEPKEINVMVEGVEKAMKEITTLKSLAAYYDHAYKQWGKIGSEILQHSKIRPHFVYYRVNVSELVKLLDEIKAMAKHNEKAVYQFIEKVSWKLEDIKSYIAKIMEGAKASGYLEAYKNHECINGDGRRLGLQTLVNKSYTAISQIESVINTLQKITEDGTDPFKYGEHMSIKAKSRCWA